LSISEKNTANPWQLSVQYLKGIGEKLAKVLAQVPIETFGDLLFHLPRTYEDRRRFCGYKEISESVQTQNPIVSRALIENYSHHRASGRGRQWLEAAATIIEDKESLIPRRLTFVWFQEARFIEKSFPVGSTVIFQGKAQVFRGRLQVAHPQFQKTEKDLAPWEYGRFVPVYPETMGISTRVFRKVIYQALLRPDFDSLKESLPDYILTKLSYPALKKSLKEIHFPENWQPVDEESYFKNPFYQRLAFEELFYLSLALSLRSQYGKSQEINKDLIPNITNLTNILDNYSPQLPFKLTNAQVQVIHDIAKDLHTPKTSMHRLLQGDVGSGKTIVSFLSMIAAFETNFTSLLMAPTEILADQHYKNFTKLFPAFAEHTVLLKSSLSAKEKRVALEKLASQKASIVIGTQALLFTDEPYFRLGLVVIDEQHRFGVRQRLALKKHSASTHAHLLVMTATPIPRSLSLTLYGDLKLSQIKEKPAGRIPIKTYLLREKSRTQLQERLKVFLAEGRQIYLVYPLIEENEELELKDVQRAYQEWCSIFASYKIGLLHGRMKAQEKDEVMREFSEGKIHVLVAITVIEVKID
jgi:ATP-dependent DNA helicase RecG